MLLSPGSLNLRQGRSFPPPGLPLIDWTHPLAQKLMCVLYVHGGQTIDLVSGIVVPKNTLSPRDITVYGEGVKSNAAGSGLSMTAWPSLKVTGPISCFWRGVANQAFSSNQTFIGVSANNAGTSPFVAWDLSTNTNAGAKNLAMNWSAGGALGQVTANQFPAVYPTPFSFLATCNPNGTSLLYKNGLLISTSSSGPSFNGSPTYTSTSQLYFMGPDNNGAGGIGCTGGLAVAWNRALTQPQATLMNSDPFCFLIFPQDRIVTVRERITQAQAVYTFLAPYIGNRVFDFPVKGSVLSGVSGAIGVSQGSSVAAINALAGIISTIAVTQGSNLAAINALAGIISHIAATQGADTASLAGLAGVIGSIAASQGADTASLVGTRGLAAAIAALQGSSTAAVVGSVKFSAAIALVQHNGVTSISGFIPPTAAVALEQGDSVALVRAYLTGPGIRRQTGYQPVPEVSSDNVEHRRKLAVAVNGLLAGKMNAVTSLTLTPSATSSTITDARIGPLSFLYLQPLTANAAAELASGNVFIPTTTQGQGSAVIQHTNNSQIDRSYNVLIIG